MLARLALLNYFKCEARSGKMISISFPLIGHRFLYFVNLITILMECHHDPAKTPQSTWCLSPQIAVLKPGSIGFAVLMVRQWPRTNGVFINDYGNVILGRSTHPLLLCHTNLPWASTLWAYIRLASATTLLTSTAGFSWNCCHLKALLQQLRYEICPWVN